MHHIKLPLIFAENPGPFLPKCANPNRARRAFSGKVVPSPHSLETAENSRLVSVTLGLSVHKTAALCSEMLRWALSCNRGQDPLDRE